jgi:hypothetical protein
MYPSLADYIRINIPTLHYYRVWTQGLIVQLHTEQLSCDGLIIYNSVIMGFQWMMHWWMVGHRVLHKTKTKPLYLLPPDHANLQ